MNHETKTKKKYSSYHLTLDRNGNIAIQRVSPVLADEKTWVAENESGTDLIVCGGVFNASSEEEAKDKFKDFLFSIKGRG
jgi:hypothetical protein